MMLIRTAGAVSTRPNSPWKEASGTLRTVLKSL